jgi:hypothetical protein
MPGVKYELAQVISSGITGLSKQHGLSKHQLKVLRALVLCRTHFLGGHEMTCQCCGSIKYLYNSCRNRHCPKCGGIDRERWVTSREQDLLPVNYYHVVFTVPICLHPLFLFHPVKMYQLLFKTCWDVIDSFAQNPRWLGAKTGAVAILHTWTQLLDYHPHIHFILPAGGIDKNGKWKNAANHQNFLFPVKAMSEVFRAKFAKNLRLFALENKIIIRKQIFVQIFEKPWVVYAKEPFNGPKQVIKYLGKYTHRVAISNQRILKIENGKVTFSYRDRNMNYLKKTIAISVVDFLKRFIKHILPLGFQRIRHYGFLSSRLKTKALELLRRLMGLPKPIIEKKTWAEIVKTKWNIDPLICKYCGGKMTVTRLLHPLRAPPFILSPSTNNAILK